jgi:hypothetical protein
MGGHAAAQSVSLSAVLLGGNECDSTAPPLGPICRKGDPDAFGRATITFPTSTTICVTLQVDNLAGATAAHIHSGRETVNGPIVFVLPPPSAPRRRQSRRFGHLWHAARRGSTGGTPRQPCQFLHQRAQRRLPLGSDARPIVLIGPAPVTKRAASFRQRLENHGPRADWPSRSHPPHSDGLSQAAGSHK